MFTVILPSLLEGALSIVSCNFSPVFLINKKPFEIAIREKGRVERERTEHFILVILFPSSLKHRPLHSHSRIKILGKIY